MAHIASAWLRAWLPAPTIPTTAESSRLKYLAATALVAPTRMT
jgi:hypothetical protein